MKITSRQTTSKHLETFLRRQPVVSGRLLKTKGFSLSQVARLIEKGKAERLGRGIYRHVETPIPDHLFLTVAALKVTGGVICLLSALELHGMGTQQPSSVWIAVGRGRTTPKIDWPKLRIVRLCDAGLTEGVEARRVEGVRLQVTSPARTVIDCFKFRNQIGLVAIEALREYHRQNLGTIDDLLRLARTFRMEGILTPYLQMLVS